MKLIGGRPFCHESNECFTDIVQHQRAHPLAISSDDMMPTVDNVVDSNDCDQCNRCNALGQLLCFG